MKQKKTEKWKQIPAHLTIVVIVSMVLLMGCGKKEMVVAPNFEYTIEVGSEPSTDAKDYVTVTVDGEELTDLEGFTVDTSQIDTEKEGLYNVTVSYENKMSVFQVMVVD